MTGLKILIVEDEALIAESLREILEVLGHETTAVASTAEEALLALESATPDLILLDIQLKGKMDGIQLAAIIRDRHRLPFVFTTAFADDETIYRAKAESPFGYLVKPYGINDIKAAIQMAMSSFQLVKELSTSNPGHTHTENGKLYLKVDKRLVKVNENDILYVEAKGDYMLFKTISGSHIVLSTMANVTAKLNDSLFMQVHRSFSVNLNHIDDIEESTLVIGKKVIPVSRGKRKELLSKINTL